MLEALRGFVGGWVAKIFLGLLIVSFAVWGIAGEIFGPSTGRSVVVVGETKVPADQWRAVYANNLEQASQRFGRRLNQQQARLLGVENQATAQVVTGAVFDEYARTQGLHLSDDQLRQLIGQEVAFQDSSGVFDRNRFREAVRNAQMTEAAFVDQQGRAALRSQVSETLVDGAVVPRTFKDALASYAGERRVADVVTVDVKAAGIPTQPSDEELQAYFDGRKAEYKAPEYRRIAVLTLDPETIADPTAVSDEEIAARYQERAAEYRTPERRRVQQIRFADRAKADAARTALNEGALFETVMQEAGVSESDADLGLLARNRIPDAKVAEAIFSLPVNEASAVIDGRFGPVIVRAVEVQPEVVRPLEEVRDEIRQRIALERAAETRVVELQEAVMDARAGGDPLETAAKANDLPVRVVEVDRRGQDKAGNAVSDLPSSAELLRRAFEASPGEDTPALSYGSQGSAWFEVLDVEAERDRAFDEARDDALADFMAEAQAKQLDAKAEEVATALRAGEDAAAVAERFGAAVTRTEPVGRQGNAPASIGEEGRSVLFSGPVGEVGIAPVEGNSKRAVIRVADIEGDSEALTDVQIAALDDQAADDVLAQMLAKLQASYGARVNQQLIENELSRY